MAEPVDVADDAKTPPAALDADIAALVNMGLKPSDIERIYHAVHGVDAEAVKEACRRLVGSQSVEIGRQVSVGLALLTLVAACRARGSLRGRAACQRNRRPPI